MSKALVLYFSAIKLSKVICLTSSVCVLRESGEFVYYIHVHCILASLQMKHTALQRVKDRLYQMHDTTTQTQTLFR